ncbi:MAG: DUF2029 domain-containing protein [Candidatus Lokiarchaeota archaeon]|nr:DUF2029 domain-containing protein [Candidatus Lokiarchaeota archaeon]
MSISNIKETWLFNDLKELLKSKTFRISLFINLVYVIVSTFLTLFIFRTQNDFLVYYDAGGKFLNDINNLYTYNPELSWQFRYFPLSALFFVPFYSMGFELGFITSQILNFCINILICVFIYKIILVIKKNNIQLDKDRVILYISIFLISVPQFYNYILGQINLYITLLILISLYIFLKKDNLIWQLIASSILGITINLKPITIFMIPFLIFLGYNYKRKKFYFDIKRSLLRFIGVLIPVSFNLLLFFVYPSLWEGFIETNLLGEQPVDINHSFSITKLIINGFDFLGSAFNQLVIILIIFLIFFGIAIIIYIFRRNSENSLIYGYCLGIIIMLIVYFDSWDHHLLILTPILIIIISNLDNKLNARKKYIFPSFIYFSFLSLLFLGIYYLLINIFPFNFVPTIFLIVILLGIYRHLLKNENNIINNENTK